MLLVQAARSAPAAIPVALGAFALLHLSPRQLRCSSLNLLGVSLIVAGFAVAVALTAWLHTLITRDSILVSLALVLLTAWTMRVNLALAVRGLAEEMGLDLDMPLFHPRLLLLVAGAVGGAAAAFAERVQAEIPGIRSLVGVVSAMFLVALLDNVEAATG